MLFEDKLHDIIKTLETSGLLLAPVEFAWGVIFDPKSSIAWTKVQQLDIAYDTTFVFVDSIKMLKICIPDLHPRVETLLLYHRRPLGIVRPKLQTFAVSTDPVVYCLSFDPYIKNICQLHGSPIACIYCQKSNKPIGLLKNVGADIATNVDYISKHKKNKDIKGVIPMIANYDDEGLLEFNNQGSLENWQ